jgi:hypothetical protein
MKYKITWEDRINKNKEPIKIETNSLISFNKGITIMYIDSIRDTIFIGLDVEVKEDRDLKHFYIKV